MTILFVPFKFTAIANLIVTQPPQTILCLICWIRGSKSKYYEDY
jgi:hypothetical protein